MPGLAQNGKVAGKWMINSMAVLGRFAIAVTSHRKNKSDGMTVFATDPKVTSGRYRIGHKSEMTVQKTTYREFYDRISINCR